MGGQSNFPTTSNDSLGDVDASHFTIPQHRVDPFVKGTPLQTGIRWADLGRARALSLGIGPSLASMSVWWNSPLGMVKAGLVFKGSALF